MHTKNNLNNTPKTASPAGDQSADVKGKTQLPTPMSQVILAARSLERFISPAELETLGNACRGEEREFFKAKMVELADVADNMPTSTKRTGKAIRPWCACTISLPTVTGTSPSATSSDEQLQAFGLACIWEQELGYITIQN